MIHLPTAGKILEFILVPMFQYSFERGDTAVLIEGTTEGAANIIDVFMHPDSHVSVLGVMSSCTPTAMLVLGVKEFRGG